MLGADYNETTDIWSLACLVRLNSHEEMFELITGDYLFDPKSGTKYSRDDGKQSLYSLLDHMAQIIELIGQFPKHLLRRGKYVSELFNRKGELRAIKKLNYWKLEQVLIQKYHFEPLEAAQLDSFLTPMMNIDSEKR